MCEDLVLIRHMCEVLIPIPIDEELLPILIMCSDPWSESCVRNWRQFLTCKKNWYPFSHVREIDTNSSHVRGIGTNSLHK